MQIVYKSCMLSPMKHPKPYRLYYRKDTGYWYYRLPEEKKWKSTGCTKENDAHGFVIKNVLPGGERSPTLKEFAEPAFDTYVRAKRKARTPLSSQYVVSTRNYIKRYLLKDKIADIPLAKLSIDDYQEFQDRITEETLPDRQTTAIRVLETARLILRRAEKTGKIEQSPDRAVVMPKQEAQIRAIYTDEELNRLFPADVFDKNDFSPWKDRFDYTVFILAASTGMRKGELLALEWSAVHLEEGKEYLEIRGSMQPSGKIGPTKGKRPRATPIFDFVLWPERRAVKALEELRAWSKKRIGILNMEGNPEGPVFSYMPNQRAGRTWFQKRLAAALKKTEIQRDRGEGIMAPDAHSFRHTLASHLKAAGLSDDLIRRFCGWSSLAVQSRYTHIEPEIFDRLKKLIQATQSS